MCYERITALYNCVEALTNNQCNKCSSDFQLEKGQCIHINIDNCAEIQLD